MGGGVRSLTPGHKAKNIDVDLHPDTTRKQERSARYDCVGFPFSDKLIA